MAANALTATKAQLHIGNPPVEGSMGNAAGVGVRLISGAGVGAGASAGSGVTVGVGVGSTIASGAGGVCSSCPSPVPGSVVVTGVPATPTVTVT